jgi:biopolymer transport protein TolR
MVTAPMMLQGVDVSLPEATSEPLDSEKDHLIITIDQKNQIYINDYKVSVDFLSEKLAKILEGRDERAVFLKADENIPWGTVAKVMAQAKDAGVENLGMVTEPETFDKETKRKK